MAVITDTTIHGDGTDTDRVGTTGAGEVTVIPMVGEAIIVLTTIPLTTLDIITTLITIPIIGLAIITNNRNYAYSASRRGV